MEKKIEYPYFSKCAEHGEVFYKVIDDDTVISVKVYDFDTSIDCSKFTYALAFDDTIQITESEFVEAFTKAVGVLNQKLKL